MEIRCREALEEWIRSSLASCFGSRLVSERYRVTPLLTYCLCRRSQSGLGGSMLSKCASTSKSYAQLIRATWIPNRARNSPRVL